MTATLPTLGVPDPLALLAGLTPLVDDGMLQEIAAADYGLKIPEHYAWLQRMTKDGALPPAQFVPREVLELIRWSRPDEAEWRPGGTGQRGHLMRAFCCAWILRMAGEREEYYDAAGTATTIQLLGSLERLELPFWREAWGLLDWFRPNWSLAGQDDEDALLGVAQLYCALRAGFASDRRLIGLCEWIVAREAEIGSRWAFDERWGLRAEHDIFGREEWRALG